MNIDYNEKIERLANWFRGKPSPPFKIVLNPTNRCNLKCMFCPNALPRSEKKFKAEDELSYEIWLRLSKEALNFGVREWSIIGGGEPLLRRDAIFPMINLIKNFGEVTDCELITNGTLFRKEDIEKLVELKMDRILFSIDAPDAETHDYFRRVKGTFEKSTENLKAFSDLKKRFNTDKPYLKVNMVLNNRNYKIITKMVKFINTVGAQELALHPMREYWELNSQIRHLKMNKLQKNEMIKEIHIAERISDELGVLLNTDMIDMEREEVTTLTPRNKTLQPKLEIEKKILATNCFEPFYTIYIDPNGNVGQCSPAGSGYEDLNLKEKTIKDIWYSQKLNSIRKLTASGGSLECCSKCGLVDVRENIRRELLKFFGEFNGPNTI